MNLAQGRRGHLERHHVQESNVTFLSVATHTRDPASVSGDPTSGGMEMAVQQQLRTSRVPHAGDLTSGGG